MYFEQSDIDSNSTIIFGRPKGGLAIMFKRSLAGYMSKLETNSHWTEKRANTVFLRI